MSLQFTNALIDETSPYLLQHAHNPVNWYPWGDRALAVAKEQQKPLLLSIGYSACHWCHVMAHESFENETIAGLMNEYFINIKVDREERPDLDKIYQQAYQLMMQRPGGWPLNMFLHHDDQMPFYAGTYFPPEPRYGMPSFSQILQQLHTAYQSQQDKIVQSRQSLARVIEEVETPVIESRGRLDAEPLNTLRAELEGTFDSVHGGFGKAPKFPHLSSIECLMHHYLMSREQGQPDNRGLEIVHLSLQKMALGGLFDHLGGGFCRYSVDDYWMIPHFEKMLYDNGPFLGILSEAWQLFQDSEKLEKAPIFKRTALQTADWAIREMQSPEGGFYSTLDADSEAEEGKFYTWTPAEIEALLDNELTYSLFATHYGLDRESNFEGRWHLHVYQDREDLSQQFNLPLEEVDKHLQQACTALFNLREARIHPARDEKILTSWNALMIKGLALAGRIFQRPDYIQAAAEALDFIFNTLWVDGRLLATYKDGKAHLSAYLDDYAFLLDAIIHLLQARWRDQDMAFAIELAEVLLKEFEDKQAGGFYFTAHDHEVLISRSKSYADESVPAGNAAAARSLGRLGHILGESRYLESAEKCLQSAWPLLQQMPVGHASMLLALEDYLFPPQTIILRGKSDEMRSWQAVCQHDYSTQRLCFAIPDSARALPGVLAERKPMETVVAYLCKGYQCSVPVTSVEDLTTELLA